MVLLRSSHNFSPRSAALGGRAGGVHAFASAGQRLLATGKLSYQTVDVFTDAAHGGNPLAVVFGAAGLCDGDLLAIAREFNYSETTFVLPPVTALPA